MLNLYDQYGVLKASFEPDDSSEQNAELQSGNELSLSFTMYECVVFEVNDYIDFEGTRFWAIEQYTPDQTSTVEWECSVTLYGVESIVQRYLVLKLSNDEYDPIFSYTATAQGHMELIVAALNDGMGTSEWKVGEVVSTEYIVIDYNCTYANEALSNLASEAGTEFWFDNGMTINLTQAEHSEEITLAYGNGLLNLYRENADNVAFFTRFIPIGSSRNIVYDDYGYTRLQLPDKAKYVDIDVDKYGIIHYAETDAFSDIYPRRIGAISSVRAEERINDDGDTFYVYYVKDDTLTFDPNDYMMDGLVINVTFQSGDLNGRDFEVNYNSTTEEFEIINQYPYDDSTIQLPGSLLMEVGDTYALWNLEMPSEYRTLAEIEYEEAVYAFIEENLKDIGIYKGTTDYVELEKRDVILTIGQRIRLESDKYFPSTGYRSSRITKLTRNVNHPKTIDIEVSDVLSTGSIAKINDDITAVKNYTEQAVSDIPDIIKSWESTPAADTNLYSSKKSVKEFLSKTKEDTAQELIKFEKGVQSNLFKTPSWSGASTTGQGGAMYEDATTGESTIVAHNIVAKNGITSPMFTVRIMTATGGIEVTSAAYATITSVVEGDDSYVCFYKCAGQIWQALDQARLQGNLGRFYWGLVTAVGSEANADGEYAFAVSKTDVSSGTNTVPAVDDTLVLYGNRSSVSSNTYRKSVMIKSCGVDNESEGYYPYDGKFNDIDDFSLPKSKAAYWNGKDFFIKVNSFTIVSASTGEEIDGETAINDAQTSADNAQSSVDGLSLSSVNLWEECNVTAGFLQGTDGAFVASSSLACHQSMEEYIAVDENTNFTWQIWNPNFISNSTYSNRFFFYDSDKTKLSYTTLPNLTSDSYQSGVIEVPSGAAYVRFGLILGTSSGGRDADMQAKITAGNKADGSWSESVADAEARIANLQVGGVNIVDGTIDSVIRTADMTSNSTFRTYQLGVDLATLVGQNIVVAWDYDLNVTTGTTKYYARLVLSDSYTSTSTGGTKYFEAEYFLPYSSTVVESGRFEKVLTVPTDMSSKTTIKLYLQVLGGEGELSNLKIEVGNVATAYSYSYNDQATNLGYASYADMLESIAADGTLAAKTKGFTQIEGGVVLTNVIQTTSSYDAATATDDDARAGISGLTTDNVAFFAHPNNAYNIAKAYAEYMRDGGSEPSDKPHFLATDNDGVLISKALIGNMELDNNTLAFNKPNSTIAFNSSSSGGAMSLTNNVLSDVGNNGASTTYASAFTIQAGLNGDIDNSATQTVTNSTAITGAGVYRIDVFSGMTLAATRVSMDDLTIADAQVWMSLAGSVSGNLGSTLLRASTVTGSSQVVGMETKTIYITTTAAETISMTISASVTATLLESNASIHNISQSTGFTINSVNNFTQLAIDGIQLVASSDCRYIAKIEDGRIIIIANIPTSSSGLVTGSLYQSGGYVRIVQ